MLDETEEVSGIMTRLVTPFRCHGLGPGSDMMMVS